jgi:hypothetical protein
MNNLIFVQLYLVIILGIFVYCILKEREEFGCSGITVKKQCNELKSIFFKSTTPLNTDTKKQLINKLKEILRLHEKNAVWRRCFILATIIIFVFKITNSEIKFESIITLHLIIIGIIYFYHNFMNFHVYRIANTIGNQIIDKIIFVNKF